MTEYQSNSNKSKDTPLPPEKNVEKVIVGEVIQKKKSVGRKFKEVFFGGDLKYASRFVLADVILPQLRNLVLDVINKGSNGWIWGPSDYRRRQVDYPPRTQYNQPIQRASFSNLRTPVERPYMGGGPPDQPHPYRVPVRTWEFNEVILARREDAEHVLESLYNILEQYETASLADLYDLLGEPASAVHNKWGWRFLGNVQIRQIREGYVIDLPPVEAL